jgi:hypothetical protein
MSLEDIDKWSEQFHTMMHQLQQPVGSQIDLKRFDVGLLSQILSSHQTQAAQRIPQ